MTKIKSKEEFRYHTDIECSYKIYSWCNPHKLEIEADYKWTGVFIVSGVIATEEGFDRVYGETYTLAQLNSLLIKNGLRPLRKDTRRRDGYSPDFTST